MYEDFQSLKETIHDELSKRYESRNPCNTFIAAANKLEAYLAVKGVGYSPEIAENWIAELDNNAPRHHFYLARRMIGFIEGLRKTGVVPQEVKVERRTNLSRLPQWCQSEINEFIVKFAANHTPDTIDEMQRCVVNFMAYLTREHQGQWKYDWEQLKAYRQVIRCKTDGSLQSKLSLIRQFIKHLETKGIAPPESHKALEDRISKDLVLLTELDEETQAIFLQSSDSPPLSDLQQRRYSQAAHLLSIHLAEGKYKETSTRVALQLISDLNLFFIANSLPLRMETAALWVEFGRKRWSKAKHRAMRRAFEWLVAILDDEDVVIGCIRHKREGRRPLSDVHEGFITRFAYERTRSGISERTIRGDVSSIARFLRFVEQAGSTVREVDADFVLDYVSRDLRDNTQMGRAESMSNIKLFLKFLGEQKIVAEHLHLVLAVKKASRVGIVRTLPGDAMEALEEYRGKASTPMELRNVAMVMLGLFMGLRACDIVELRLQDISLHNKVIDITQKKTGIRIVQPMPMEVANSLYRYIKEGRPVSRHPKVFVTHLDHSMGGEFATANACSRAVQAIFGVKGFHILRRTFASRMLVSGTPVPLIATALGHAGLDNVDQYLSTDAANMRTCPLSLDGLVFQGGRL